MDTQPDNKKRKKKMKNKHFDFTKCDVKFSKKKTLMFRLNVTSIILRVILSESGNG